MTSNYVFLALCLLLIQIPGFLMKPSDFDSYDDGRRWGPEPRGELNSYYSPKAVHAGFDNNYKLSGKKVQSAEMKKDIISLIQWYTDLKQRERTPIARQNEPLLAYTYYNDE